jgi:hypothetical protein
LAAGLPQPKPDAASSDSATAGTTVLRSLATDGAARRTPAAEDLTVVGQRSELPKLAAPVPATDPTGGRSGGLAERQDAADRLADPRGVAMTRPAGPAAAQSFTRADNGALKAAKAPVATNGPATLRLGVDPLDEAVDLFIYLNDAPAAAAPSLQPNAAIQSPAPPTSAPSSAKAKDESGQSPAKPDDPKK